MRSAGPRQLTFVFADSPQGGEQVEASGAPEDRAWLLHITSGKKVSGPAAQAADGRWLLGSLAGNLRCSAEETPT